MSAIPFKIAVTGARGMLGAAILSRFSEHFSIYATSREKGICKENINWDLFDLADTKKLTKWLLENKPDVVIHCAAMVNVDECEKEMVRAEQLHIESTRFIAQTISSWHGRLVYISTDAVFDGKKTGLYAESDSVSPLSAYGRTKYLGEVETLQASNHNLVLRTTLIGHQKIAARVSFSDWLIDGLYHQKPLLLFSDVMFTPIHVTHFSNILFNLLTSDKKISGLFHLSGNTTLSKYEFGVQLANEFGFCTACISSVTLENTKLIASRSKNMMLSNAKLTNKINVSFPVVRDAIAQLKSEYLHNLREKNERN